VTLQELKEVQTVFIGADFVDLPAVELAKQGFRPGYNLIVFVVTPEPKYTWVNANGTKVDGQDPSTNHRASLIRTYGSSDIEALLKSQGLPDGLILTLQ
jgi:hypothetical protein